MNDNELTREQKKLVKTVVSVVVGIILLIILWPFRTVSAGSVGVVTRFGAINRVANPGIMAKIPLIEGLHVMNTQTQKDQVEAQAASNDIQVVKSTIAVNYHLDGAHAPDVYQRIGTSYQDIVVSPAIQDTFKSITAKYTAPDLIAKREEVRYLALQELTTKLQPYNIIVDNFNIVNFDFSDDYNKAIEAKVKAQQNKEQAQIEAETALIQANGQANAQKALKDSGALSPEYLQYKAITAWNGILPTYWGGNALPFLNVGK
jgi:regulator of protease activity HflC (stomatin/prohibitin superfamily)